MTLSLSSPYGGTVEFERVADVPTILEVQAWASNTGPSPHVVFELRDGSLHARDQDSGDGVTFARQRWDLPIPAGHVVATSSQLGASTLRLRFATGTELALTLQQDDDGYRYELELRADARDGAAATVVAPTVGRPPR